MIEVPKSICTRLYQKTVLHTLTNGKPIAVYCSETGKLFKYFVAGREAARRLKLHHNCIQERVGTGKAYQGYRFEFVTDEHLIERIRNHFKQRKLEKLFRDAI